MGLGVPTRSAAGSCAVESGVLARDKWCLHGATVQSLPAFPYGRLCPDAKGRSLLYTLLSRACAKGSKGAEAVDHPDRPTPCSDTPGGLIAAQRGSGKRGSMPEQARKPEEAAGSAYQGKQPGPPRPGRPCCPLTLCHTTCCTSGSRGRPPTCAPGRCPPASCTAAPPRHLYEAPPQQGGCKPTPKQAPPEPPRSQPLQIGKLVGGRPGLIVYTSFWLPGSSTTLSAPSWWEGSDWSAANPANVKAPARAPKLHARGPALSGPASSQQHKPRRRPRAGALAAADPGGCSGAGGLRLGLGVALRGAPRQGGGAGTAGAQTLRGRGLSGRAAGGGFQASRAGSCRRVSQEGA